MGKQILQTTRLRLREFKVDDTNFIIELVNSPGWLQYIGYRNIHTQEAAMQYLVDGPLKMYTKYGYGLWCIELGNQGLPIGMCGLLKRDYLDHPDLGYALLPAHEGHGYATEAAQGVLKLASSAYQLPKVLAITNLENTLSIRVLEKLGFTFERFINLPAEQQALKLFGCDLMVS